MTVIHPSSPCVCVACCRGIHTIHTLVGYWRYDRQCTSTPLRWCVVPKIVVVGSTSPNSSSWDTIHRLPTSHNPTDPPTYDPQRCGFGWNHTPYNYYKAYSLTYSHTDLFQVTKGTTMALCSTMAWVAARHGRRAAFVSSRGGGVVNVPRSWSSSLVSCYYSTTTNGRRSSSPLASPSSVQALYASSGIGSDKEMIAANHRNPPRTTTPWATQHYRGYSNSTASSLSLSSLESSLLMPQVPLSSPCCFCSVDHYIPF